MKKRKTFVLILFLFAFFISCENNPLLVDISETQVKINYINVDRAFFDASLSETKTKHDHFIDSLDPLYLFEIQQNLRVHESDTLYKAIHRFYHSEYIQALEKAKSAIQPNLSSLQERANKAFRYLHFHFEKMPIPRQIIYMNKLFSNIHCSDSAASIGLESYLPRDNDVLDKIPKNQLYEWQRERMDKEFMPRDLAMNWVQVHLFEEIDKKLAEHIVQAGKILYVLNAAFPEAEPRYILRYSEEDLTWALNHEQMVWDYLVKEQLLFKNNRRDKANFLNAGPKTVGLPEEAPDRLGQFLGYRMVKKYMHQNKALSLPELLQLNYNEILQKYEID